MGTVGFMVVLVMFQLWKMLRSVERLLTDEVRRMAEDVRLTVEDIRKAIQEATHLIASVQENVGHMNSTFARLGDTAFKVAEMFQAPWMKTVGFVKTAVDMYKKWKGGNSKSGKRKR